MARYASQTDVASDRSRAEIEKTLRRYGAAKFAYASEDERAAILFEHAGRRVRFILPLPSRTDKAFVETPTGKPRTIESASSAYEQAVRQKWRALALAVKAKLEAVESGIATFEDEFLAYVVLPDGKTAGEWLRPQIAEAYESGRMPPMLGLPAPER